MSDSIQWINLTKKKEWLTLFSEVFSSQMSENFLEWKYRDTKKMGVALKDEEKLVAFYGGMPRDALYNTKPIKAVQIGDVMVHPNQRGAFTRKGAFWKVATTYAEAMIGKNKEYDIAFGFPSKRAYMLGKRLNLYDAVDSLLELSWNVIRKPFFSLWRGRQWKDSDINALPLIWEKMSISLNQSLVGVRDEKWLQERYLNHPDSIYSVLSVHRFWSSRIDGVLILRNHDDGSIEWIDMIGDVALIPQFWNVAYRFCYKRAAKRLFCWMTKSHLDVFKMTNPQVHDIDIVIPLIVHNSSLDLAKIKNRWWLMAGDTDFR